MSMVVDETQCPRWTKRLPAEARFCRRCGQPVDAGITPDSPGPDAGHADALSVLAAAARSSQSSRATAAVRASRSSARASSVRRGRSAGRVALVVAAAIIVGWGLSTLTRSLGSPEVTPPPSGAVAGRGNPSPSPPQQVYVPVYVPAYQSPAAPTAGGWPPSPRPTRGPFTTSQTRSRLFDPQFYDPMPPGRVYPVYPPGYPPAPRAPLPRSVAPMPPGLGER